MLVMISLTLKPAFSAGLPGAISDTMRKKLINPAKDEKKARWLFDYRGGNCSLRNTERRQPVIRT
jgi:hypothetical protein